MPKASKKKQRKAEDFKKVKLKVGKKKAAPTNATDTSFASRSIMLAGQSIVTDKSAELTNSRNLTLKDLMSQLRHYSTPVRKEAVLGLADLIERYPEILKAELGPVVEGSARLIVDNEPPVRRALLRFYSSVLPDLPAQDLAPFVPLLVIFTCSAMTHILGDIRADAVKFLDLLSEIAPESVAQHAPQILPNLFTLLETNTPTMDGKVASVNSRTALLTSGDRLSIMRSCYNYLMVYTKPANASTEDPLWFMADFSGLAAVGGINRHIDLNCDSSRQYLYPNVSAPFSSLSLFGDTTAGTNPLENDSGQSSTEIRTQSKEALRRLFPFLLATWMESSTIFSTDSINANDKSLELCLFVVQILQVLWRSAYRKGIPSNHKQLVDFLRRSMIYFPFGQNYTGNNPEVEETLLSLNIRVAELAAMIQLDVANPDKELARFSKRAAKFVRQEMGTKSASTSISLKQEHFVDVLLIVWKLLNVLSTRDAERMLSAVISHVDNVCQPHSESKVHCVQFLSTILELQWSRQYGEHIADLKASDLILEWVLGLPKMMWQLRNRNLPASTAAAKTLRLVVQRTRLLAGTYMQTLEASLVPLFCVEVPGKGTVFGPFRQYPPDLQRVVIETVSYLQSSSTKLQKAIDASSDETTITSVLKI